MLCSRTQIYEQIWCRINTTRTFLVWTWIYQKVINQHTVFNKALSILFFGKHKQKQKNNNSSWWVPISFATNKISHWLSWKHVLLFRPLFTSSQTWPECNRIKVVIKTCDNQPACLKTPAHPEIDFQGWCNFPEFPHQAGVSYLKRSQKYLSISWCLTDSQCVSIPHRNEQKWNITMTIW